jgi:hypothetical protein
MKSFCEAIKNKLSSPCGPQNNIPQFFQFSQCVSTFNTKYKEFKTNIIFPEHSTDKSRKNTRCGGLADVIFLLESMSCT